MARETDFLDLYKILGLNPDCELAEFKRAYRRRVLVLHPDRRAHEPSDEVAAERLQRLTALYGEAMAFQRRHGRLPGGAPAARSIRTPAPRPLPAATATLSRDGSRRLLILLGVCSLVWLLWVVAANAKPVAATSPAATTIALLIPPSDSEPVAAAPLQLGMSPDAVRATEGEPLITVTGRWEYGPSWILFENDRVADWYSSPLRPLKSAHQRQAQQSR